MLNGLQLDKDDSAHHTVLQKTVHKNALSVFCECVVVAPHVNSLESYSDKHMGFFCSQSQTWKLEQLHSVPIIITSGRASDLYQYKGYSGSVILIQTS